MALRVARLINLRSPFLQQFKNTNYIFTSARISAIKIVKDLPPSDESWTDRNIRLKRPLSPHLTIYKAQMNSMLSITHRITGMVISAYAMLLGLSAIVLPHEFCHYITMMEGLSPSTIYTLKLIIAFPFAFHYVSGIRHLVWDYLATFLTNRDLRNTGLVVITGTIILTAALVSL